MSLLPEMLPSIVLVFGIMLFWNAIYKIIPLYNTIWIMVLAYVVLYLPYTVQYVTSAFIGICPALQAYLDEFCFRFNRRKTGDQIFLRLARAVAASCAQLH